MKPSIKPILFVLLVCIFSPTFAQTTCNYVDLGLSAKWATCNIGATSPEESGRFFAWGDVEGQSWNGREWSNGGFIHYLEYKLDSNCNLSIQYDAACTILGDGWRMPTLGDIEELFANCDITWSENFNGTGVSGRVFTSRKSGYEGSFIFLPATGYGDRNALHCTGTDGHIWLSSFGLGFYAWNLGFGTSYTDAYRISQYYGFPIRAVHL